MKTIEIANAEGPVLNWLVAKALHPGRDANWITAFVNAGVDEGYRPFAPSADPAQGHQLIEDHIHTLIRRNDAWYAECQSEDKGSFCYCLKGPTALIASMRAFVTARTNGPTARVPQELAT